MVSYRVFHLIVEPYVVGAVDVDDGRLVFHPLGRCPEPYRSMFQAEILEPLQGVKLKCHKGKMRGPPDATLNEEAARAYGRALERKLKEMKLDGNPINGFSYV